MLAKCGVLCFELYFERMPFLPFLFYSPYAGFFAKLHPQACKTRKLFGSGLPEVLSLSAKHSDHKSAKIGCQALKAHKISTIL